MDQYRELRRGGEPVTEEERRDWQERQAKFEALVKPGAPRARLVPPDSSDG